MINHRDVVTTSGRNQDSNLTKHQAMVQKLSTDIFCQKILRQIDLFHTLTAADISNRLGINITIVEDGLAKMRRHRIITTVLADQTIYYGLNPVFYNKIQEQ